MEDVEKPALKKAHLLINVEANSSNLADGHILRGKTFFDRFSIGLFKPKDKILGADFAGIVIKAGQGVTKFKAGDHIFSQMHICWAFAQYVFAPESAYGLMP
jgi:NADPH:quinone reductase-like Zn-dependent oxidoreductase